MNQAFNLINTIQQFRQNPQQMLAQRFNLPQNVNDPQAIIQHLLNTGQISQEQVNQAMRMKNDPSIRQFFK